MKKAKRSFKEFINKKKIAELDKQIKELGKQIEEYEGIELEDKLPTDYIILILKERELIKERDKLK
jgi:uncharacterized protein (UPF0128 family)